MKPFPKLMQYKDLIIYALSEKDGHIQGIVISGNNYWKQWEYRTNWDFNSFTDIEATQPDPTPDKDVNLRLECLKLAIQSNQGVWQNPETITTDAQHYYDWITKQ